MFDGQLQAHRATIEAERKAKESAVSAADERFKQLNV